MGVRKKSHIGFFVFRGQDPGLLDYERLNKSAFMF